MVTESATANKDRQSEPTLLVSLFIGQPSGWPIDVYISGVALYLKRAGFNVIRSSVGYRILGSRRLDSTYYLHPSRTGTPTKARCNRISPWSNRPGLPEVD